MSATQQTQTTQQKTFFIATDRHRIYFVVIMLSVVLLGMLFLSRIRTAVEGNTYRYGTVKTSTKVLKSDTRAMWDVLKDQGIVSPDAKLPSQLNKAPRAPEVNTP